MGDGRRYSSSTREQRHISKREATHSKRERESTRDKGQGHRTRLKQRNSGYLGRLQHDSRVVCVCKCGHGGSIFTGCWRGDGMKHTERSLFYDFRGSPTISPSLECIGWLQRQENSLFCSQASSDCHVVRITGQGGGKPEIQTVMITLA